MRRQFRRLTAGMSGALAWWAVGFQPGCALWPPTIQAAIPRHAGA